VAKICGARVVYQVHGGAPLERFFAQSRMLKAFLRRTLRIPDAIVVLAQSELEAYRKLVPGQHVFALPNCVDCSPYANIAREPSEPDAPLRLLYIGRLAREKGLYEALQGLRLAQLQDVGARLVIAGSGPEEAALRRFANGLGNTVSFTGPVFGAAKIALFRNADVFLLPSYSEGLPYALLESMAAGVPAIITRVGAIPDVMADGLHGLFVPPRDPHAIGRAITALAADRELLARMGDAGRKRIAASYSIEQLAREFAKLYFEIIAARSMKPVARI
jgi:glycosyltransferase involved in cell wall biosynthesis